MGMSAQCIAAVRKAAGTRQIGDAKIAALADKLDETMRQLAREDRALPSAQRTWAALTKDQRVSLAAERAIKEVQADAALVEHRAGLQVLRAAEREAKMSETLAAGATRSQAVIREIELAGMRSDAIRNEAVTGLVDMLDAVTAKDGAGVLRRVGMAIFDLDNPAMTRDVVREIFRNADGHTGNAVAAKGAKAWLDTIERMRTRFNAAGGDIGRLDYGYLSQAHDDQLVAQAGADAWAAKVLPLVDRERYLRPDGSLMDTPEVVALLKAAHETIATNGANKVEPGQFRGPGARANRGSEHRVLHFKDGDAWVAYMREFGRGSLYDAMMGHVSRVARDTALVESFGPNPSTWFRVQADLAQRADGTAFFKARGAGNSPQAYWDIATGATSTPASDAIAHVGNDLRNVQTAAKLGGAVISSLTDIATVMQTLHYDRLPMLDFVRALGGQVASAEQRRWLTTQGIVAESLSHALNRWTGEHLTGSLSGRVAGSVMKLSFMNAWSDGLRRAFGMTMMHGFEKRVGHTWAQLDEWDRHLMTQKGIGEAEWSVIAQAAPSEFNGRRYLTPEAIRGVTDAQVAAARPDLQAEEAPRLAVEAERLRADAATKWLAFVTDESQFAVVSPDMATRAVVTWGGTQAGTIKGEAARAFGQFKAFPVAMLTRHHRRIWQTPQGLEGAPLGFGGGLPGPMNPLLVTTGLLLTTTLLGALVLQTKTLLQGKDPYDMTEPRWWLRAAAQGGGLGYFGDLVFKDPTEQRGNSVEQVLGTVAGPVAGAIGGFAGDLVVVNAWEAAKGKDTHAGAEALRWINSQTPYGSLWQTRGLIEHWFLHNAQEAVNPGYLARMQQRAMRDWGQAYWWAPGEAAPARAPDLARAVGQ